MVSDNGQTQKPRPFTRPSGVGRVRTFSMTVKCKQCKKPFERPHHDWGYRIGDKDYCTYKCMRAAEQAKKPKKLKGEKKHD